MSETLKKYGRTFVRTKHGGWIEKGAALPNGSTARIHDDAIVFARAAKRMYAGVFRDGEFHAGVFRDGVFHAGVFRDGVFYGGEFRGGVFWGGVFWGGVFRGGVFHGGEFWGGVFWGGDYRASPACAQRSDGYMFAAHYVHGKLRIWAGCRNFSWDEAIAHWNDDHKHGAESQRIIHFIKAQADAARHIHYPEAAA